MDNEVKIMFVENDIKYLDLLEKICKELNLDQSLTSIKILFDDKIDTRKGMRIENDGNVVVYMHLIKNNKEFKKYPLIVETEEKWVNSKELWSMEGKLKCMPKVHLLI